MGAGIAFVCSLPLAGRIALAHAADGFVPSTLTVERVASPRQSGAKRWFAYGRLPDGSEARVPLGVPGMPPMQALPEPQPPLQPQSQSQSQSQSQPQPQPEREPQLQRQANARHQADARPARLPVMVNHALTGTWLHQQRVQVPDPALRERALFDVAKLLAIIAASLAVAALGWRRVRRLG
jgi:hypothetical protein